MRFSTKVLAYTGILTALAVILGGPLSPPISLGGAYSLNPSFGVIPVMLSGILFGPLAGGICGALTDILKFLLFPKGGSGYFPLFTLTSALVGIIPSLFFMRKSRKPSYIKLLLIVLLTQAISSMLLNTMFLVVFMGMQLAVIGPARVITQCIMIPIHTLLLFILIKYSNVYLRSYDKFTV